MKHQLNINGESVTVEAAESTPLLWVLRDHLGMTGTKYGCGMAQCGACTVLLNGSPIRSCVTPVNSAKDSAITTIEGLTTQEPVAKTVVSAWEDKAVVQCGYCQSGQIVSATALLKNNPSPNDKQIDEFMSGNICRCGTYVRIKEAIKSASKALASARDNASAVVQHYRPDEGIGNDLSAEDSNHVA